MCANKFLVQTFLLILIIFSPESSIMPKISKQTSLMIAIGIGGIALGAIVTTAAFKTAPNNAKIVSNSMKVAAEAAPKIDGNLLLSTHNNYRQKVSVPPLKWSANLSNSAQTWANRLAASGQLRYSGSNRYGENIWTGTSGSLTLTQIVDSWGEENKNFIKNKKFPEVSRTGKWQDVGHYTQIIWGTTKEVGCGFASGDGKDYLVCRYSPPGNIIGYIPTGKN